jgi:hypothetical protein
MLDVLNVNHFAICVFFQLAKNNQQRRVRVVNATHRHPVFILDPNNLTLDYLKDLTRSICRRVRIRIAKLDCVLPQHVTLLCKSSSLCSMVREKREGVD